MKWNIIQTDAHPTVRFAADELARYLSQMEPSAMIDRQIQEQASAVPGLRIGAAPQSFSFLDNAALDDAIRISVSRSGEGYIEGSNPRAVLIAVYRFLKELGCRFLRPGRDGELVPPFSETKLPVELEETPSYRHRGICIEGTNAYRNIADLIEWMPKAGLNAYFTQFRSPYGFLRRWYAHEGNPLCRPEVFTPQDAAGMQRAYTEELKRRSLMIHNVGHGWTCEPFGVHLEQWQRGKDQPDEEYRSRLAQLNGKRQLFGWTPETVWPGDSNLCYSQPETRSILTDAIVAYCRQHPETDYLHFWLADGMENHCECADCAVQRPSDWYVTMLNELEEKLSAEKLPHKIVFLIYVDLLWAPERTEIRHPERFVLMFAPITRQFHRSFGICSGPAEGAGVPVAPYVRNHLEYPVTAEANAAMLREWQKCFDGDSFDYDYHGVGAHHCDPGETEIARIMWEDMHALKDLHLNGMMSCQEQRLFFPSGLLMQVMAQTLWDRDKSFSEICREHFQAAYGQNGDQVFAYLQQISERFGIAFVREEVRTVSGQKKYAELKEAKTIIHGFLPVIEQNIRQNSDPCRKKSWEMLIRHAYLTEQEAEILLLALDKKAEEAQKSAEQLCAWLDEAEPELQTVLDVDRLKGRIRRLAKITEKVVPE
ncbi:MAG: DUF4838 domain-containing protein [Firmicutes bacterium]|nr:DUF4838 domain-containing protein [Bacillota bacterium]